MKQIKKIIWIFPLLFLSSCSSIKIPSPININPFYGTREYMNSGSNIIWTKQKKLLVSNVHDGDTITVSGKNRSALQIRIYGIDTPEMSHNVRHNWIQSYGLELNWAVKARDVTCSWLLNKEVLVGLVGSQTYDRSIASIFFKDQNGYTRNLGLQLVRLGLARVGYLSKHINSKYYVDPKYYDYIHGLENLAISEHKGIWGLSKFDQHKVFPKWNITK